MFARCNVHIVLSKLRYGHFYPKESYLHIFSSIYSTYITERKRLLPRFKLCGRMAARRRQLPKGGGGGARWHTAQTYLHIPSMKEVEDYLLERGRNESHTYTHYWTIIEINRIQSLFLPPFFFFFFLRRINIRYQRMQEKKEILAGLGGGSTLRDKVSATNRISSCSEL